MSTNGRLFALGACTDSSDRARRATVRAGHRGQRAKRGQLVAPTQNITGGPTWNVLRGNNGNDALHVDDGVNGNDTADGGPGTDTATADPGDTIRNIP